VFVTVTIPVPAPGERLIPDPARSCVTPPPPPPPAPPPTNEPFNKRVAPLTVKKFKSLVLVSNKFTLERVINPVLIPCAEPNVLTYPEVPRPTTVETRFALVTSPEPPPAVERYPALPKPCVVLIRFEFTVPISEFSWSIVARALINPERR
jgi:hypothetical protein